ncbi:MAG: hypothetical protein V1670_03490 [Candidatus Omnitrophota bacterium]
MIIFNIVGMVVIFIGIFTLLQVPVFLFFRKNVIGDLEKILGGKLKFNIFYLALNGNWCGKEVSLAILPPNVKTASRGIGEGKLTIKYSVRSSFKLKIEKKKRFPIFNRNNAFLKDNATGFIDKYSIHTDNYELTNKYLFSLENQQVVATLLDTYNFESILIMPGKIYAKKKLFSNFDVAESKILSVLKVLEQISVLVSGISGK